MQTCVYMSGRKKGGGSMDLYTHYHCLSISSGTGTFGRVYLTRFRTTNKYYAMKVLKKSEVVRLKQVSGSGAIYENKGRGKGS